MLASKLKCRFKLSKSPLSIRLNGQGKSFALASLFFMYNIIVFHAFKKILCPHGRGKTVKAGRVERETKLYPAGIQITRVRFYKKRGNPGMDIFFRDTRVRAGAHIAERRKNFIPNCLSSPPRAIQLKEVRF